MNNQSNLRRLSSKIDDTGQVYITIGRRALVCVIDIMHAHMKTRGALALLSYAVRVDSETQPKPMDCALTLVTVG